MAVVSQFEPLNEKVLKTSSPHTPLQALVTRVPVQTELSEALNAIVDSAFLDPAASWSLHWPSEYLNGTAAPLMNRFAVESVRHKKRKVTFKGEDRVWEVEEVEGVDFDREGFQPSRARRCREIMVTLPAWNEEPKVCVCVCVCVFLGFFCGGG